MRDKTVFDLAIGSVEREMKQYAFEANLARRGLAGGKENRVAKKYWRLEEVKVRLRMMKDEGCLER